MSRTVRPLATLSISLCAAYSAAQQPTLSESAPVQEPPAARAEAGVRARTDAPAATGQVRERANADIQTPAPPAAADRTYENDNASDRSIGSEINNEIQADSGANSGRAALGVTFSNGMSVGRITPNSPAAMLGLQPGDQIIRFNGEDISDVSMLTDSIQQSPLDQDVEIVFLRNGQEQMVTGRLAPWESVFASSGYGQPHTTMRYAEPYAAEQGGYVEGATSVCCDAQPVYIDPCAYDGGFYGAGYGYGWHDDRYSRRAYRRGWGWGGWGW